MGDEALRQLVDDWLEKANADFIAAERVEPDDDDHDFLYGIAAFHLQQAAEKWVKAFLAANGVSFRRTHDISRLLELATALSQEFEDLDDAASSLAPFAVEVRYPGDLMQLTKGEYEEVKDSALAIIEITRTNIESVEDD